MHTFLVQALPLPGRCNLQGRGSRAIFACVARGTEAEAQGIVLGELHRAGWKVLEVLEPRQVAEAFPGLKRKPEVARVMEAARRLGVAFLVLEGPNS